MSSLEKDLRDWLSRAPHSLENIERRAGVEHIGTVTRVGDAVASIAGLPQTRLGELLQFEDGTSGVALSVDPSTVDCVLLGGGEHTVAGMRVRGTGGVARVPVGEDLLGRVIDPLGRPLDGRPAPRAESNEPVERPAPGILDREVITEPLMTGITVVDAMIPLGRGQRALLLGDRKTGKTAFAVDTVINQRSSDVYCVYALIGQKTSTIEQVIDAVRRYGAIERCVFVVGEASATAGTQWLVPYAACSIAEHFRDKGQHALLVLDDLSKHAIAYRQISLLLRRPPGREAFPGDIFYIHSRLLERSAKLSAARGGGSLTALPIVETQAGNMSAYIPTNLISITDGQIYFEPKLFYEGQKPAVNVGLSVSRVGAKTQSPAIKDVSSSLKLDYAQFVELEVFTRFGAMVDDRTRARIEHGRRIRSILAQPQFAPRAFATQIALLLAVKERRLDDLDAPSVERFKSELHAKLMSACPEVIARIERDRTLAADDQVHLLDAIDRFAAVLKSTHEGRTGDG
jgi:F-type H+/Na+-transporting ATPase subunit alpha